ncbi:MAG: universal stress protein [Polyangiaceae bacterium]
MSPGAFSCKRILVPVDFSARSANALEFAAALGSAHASELSVLHVWHSDLSTPVMVAKERAKSALRDFVNGLELRGDVSLKRRIEHGDRYLTIQRLAQLSGYELVVVAGPEASRADAESVARGLLGSAPCPVLVVPPNAKARLRSDQERVMKLERVLVPLALAGDALQGLDYAEDLARADRGIIEVLLTADVPPAVLAQFRARPAGERVEESVLEEDSAFGVPRRVHASRLDMVVIAAKRAALGERSSDARADRVARTQTCPCLCVPG